MCFDLQTICLGRHTRLHRSDAAERDPRRLHKCMMGCTALMVLQFLDGCTVPVGCTAIGIAQFRTVAPIKPVITVWIVPETVPLTQASFDTTP